MNLHEYQAKQLLAQYGVEVPGGQPCTTANEARSIAEKLFTEGHDMVVVKIQIHSGGRGKEFSRTASKVAYIYASQLKMFTQKPHQCSEKPL